MKKIVIVTNEYHRKLDDIFFSTIQSDDVIVYDKSYGVHIDITNSVLNEYPNAEFIFILNEVMFPHILTGGGNTYNPRKSDINFDNFKNYFKNLPSNTKYIYLDNNGESPYPITIDVLEKWLNISKNNFVISSRFRNLKHSNALVGLSYLPILYMFLQQHFRHFPILEYSTPSSPKYDFITYLGQSNKLQNISNRYELLTKIFSNNLENVKYSDGDDFVVNYDLFGSGKVGHWWNLFNSLSAKIQIIFETVPFRLDDSLIKSDENEFFFTEKIMKCFVIPHPYVLIVNKKWLNELEKFGFKFSDSSKCETLDEFKNLINKIKIDINKWINDNKIYFEHNQNNLYNMAKSSNLPHHLFLDRIIKNKI